MRRGRNGQVDRNCNQGFSLVEVLVCIAILAIISLPILASIRTSAKLNYDANEVQKLTVYAQQELERIKSLSVADYEAYVLSQGGSRYEITDNTLYPEIHARAQSALSSFSGTGALSAEQQKELFTPFYCEREHIEISGKNYTMRAFFEPAPYSRENGVDQSYAQDINVSLLADIAEADGARFPVISEEINRYDGSIGSGTSAVVANMKTQMEALGIFSVDEAAIASGMKKDIEVEINTDAAKGEVEVTCDVTYSYVYGSGALDKVELYYRVYTGTYDYSPMQAEILSGTAGSLKAGEESGGNVFLFARAFQDTAFTLDESAHCINTITIVNNCAADMPVNVYLVRGYQKDLSGNSKIDYNFDSVLLNEVDYMSGDVSGEHAVGAGQFYTNIKSKNWNRCGLLSGTEFESEWVVGKGDYETRCYQVSIEMLEELESGKELEARVESTKIEK